MIDPRARERGQTLPVWTLAVLTSFALMFFALNYANTLHWQTRAQTAADAAASAALAFQALNFNKTTLMLYTADVEEWRMRHLIDAMINAGNEAATSKTPGNGGCKFSGSTSGTSGTCFPIYTSLRQQYLMALARYTTDVEILQSTTTAMSVANQTYDVDWNVYSSTTSTCSATPSNPIDCNFKYNVIDYSQRTTTMGVGKDAGFVQMGGFTQNTAPASVWEPGRIEVSACKLVNPIVNFKLFGLSPKPFYVIGRAAATNVPINEEWMAPGADINGSTGTPFQTAEVYDTSDDTFASSSSPRPWYETTYQAQPYTANPGSTSMPYSLTTFGDDFEALVSWWTAVPIAPYVTTSFSQSQLCTPTSGQAGDPS